MFVFLILWLFLRHYQVGLSDGTTKNAMDTKKIINHLIQYLPTNILPSVWCTTCPFIQAAFRFLSDGSGHSIWNIYKMIKYNETQYDTNNIINYNNITFLPGMWKIETLTQYVIFCTYMLHAATCIFSWTLNISKQVLKSEEFKIYFFSFEDLKKAWFANFQGQLFLETRPLILTLTTKIVISSLLGSPHTTE